MAFNSHQHIAGRGSSRLNGRFVAACAIPTALAILLAAAAPSDNEWADHVSPLFLAAQVAALWLGGLWAGIFSALVMALAIPFLLVSTGEVNLDLLFTSGDGAVHLLPFGLLMLVAIAGCLLYARMEILNRRLQLFLVESLEASVVPMAVVYPDGLTYRAANVAWRNVFALEGSDVRGRSARDLPESLQTVLRKMLSANIMRDRTRLTLSDAESRTCSYEVAIDRRSHRKGREYFYLSAADVTAEVDLEIRISNEQAMVRRAEERWRYILNAVADGVVELTANRVVIFANAAARRLLSVSGSDLTGTEFSLMVAAETSGMETISVLTPDGKERVLEALFTKGDELDSNIFVTLRDVSDARALEELLVGERELLRAKLRTRTSALLQMAVDLKRATADRDDFVQTISHELRTPLNGVMAAAQALLPMMTGQAGGDMVGVILASSDRLSQTISRLVNVVRDTTEHEAPARKLFDLQALAAQIDEALSLFLAAGQQVRWTLETADERWFLGDPDKISLVLLSLIENALKADQVSIVEVVVRSQASRGLQRRVRISVQDNGSETSLERLRGLLAGDLSMTRDRTDTDSTDGIGLPLSARTVASMGGELTVNRTPVLFGAGEGTVFEFGLELGAATPPRHLEGTRILVLLSPNSRLDLYQALSFQDVDVEIAENLQELPRRLSTDIFNAVLVGADQEGWASLGESMSAMQAGRWKGNRPRFVLCSENRDLKKRRSELGKLGYDDVLIEPFVARQVTAALSGLPVSKAEYQAIADPSMRKASAG